MKIHDRDNIRGIVLMGLIGLFLIFLLAGCRVISTLYIYEQTAVYTNDEGIKVDWIKTPVATLEGAGIAEVKYREGALEYVKIGNEQNKANLLQIGGDAARLLIVKEVDGD